MKGKLTCWGSGRDDQLANSLQISGNIPAYPKSIPFISFPPRHIVLGEDDDVDQVAGGYSHVCAVLRTRQVACFGKNDVRWLSGGYDFDVAGFQTAMQFFCLLCCLAFVLGIVFAVGRGAG